MKSKSSRPAPAARPLVVLLACSVLGTSPLGAQRPADRDTGAVDSAPALPRGAAASVLDTTTASFRRAPTLSDALSARTPGLSVWRSSGAVAAGSRLFLRTPTSILGGGEPLVIVDGVLVESEQLSPGVSRGDVRTSRLDDLNPDDIASVEVLRGPAAAAMYGSAASGGVLVVTTKRGAAGPTHWQAFVEGGANAARGLPSNFRRTGITTTSGTPTSVDCPLVLAARELCEPGALNSARAVEPGRAGGPNARLGAGVAASGGGGLLTYYAAAKTERDAGHYDANGARRTNLRANVSARPLSRLDVAATAFLSDGRADLPLESSILRRAIVAPWPGSNALELASYPERYFSTRATQEVRHWGGSLSARLRLASWLTASALEGIDRVRRDEGMQLPGLVRSSQDGGFYPTDYTRLTDDSSGGRTRIGTSRFDVTARFALPARVGTQTSVGFMSERARFREGISTWTGGGDTYYDIACDCTQEFRGGTSRSLEVHPRSTSYYARQRLAWRGRVHLGGGVIRSEERPLEARTYPFADAAWEVGDEGFFRPMRRWVGGLRLRAAQGEVGGGGLFGGAFDAALQSSFFLAAVESWRPERTRESEFGFDASAAGDRVTLSFTRYQRTSRDLFISIRVPNPFGYGTVLRQGGALTGRGTEVELGARLANSARLRWDATLGGSFTSNRISDLPTAPYTTPTDFALPVVQAFRVGDPLGAALGSTYSYADRNGDGLIGLDEVTIPSSASFLGSPLPTRELMLGTRATLARRVTLFGALDYRGGHEKLDRTRWERCAGTRVPTCRDALDPATSLADQAAVAASATGYAAGSRSAAGFVEDASFLRLRELGASVALPDRWAGAVGAHGASLELTGRNLATWTRYRGLDPALWGGGTLGFVDNYAQPTMRLYTMRLTLDW